MLRKIFCFTIMLLSIGSGFFAAESQEKTALLLIDIQDFYFPGGRSALAEPAAASQNARQILDHFRNTGKLIIHVKHAAQQDAEIHKNVRPQSGEKVITKHHVNAFRETGLLSELKQHRITQLVVCGMMTHMCVEAAVRAAADLGFKVILVHDACATRSLKFNGYTVSARDVHYATLSTLSRTYAQVFDTETYIKEN